MPRYTDDQIRELCAKVAKVDTEEELNHVAQELRSAIKEHVREARDSLSVKMDLLLPKEQSSGKVLTAGKSNLVNMIRLACELADERIGNDPSLRTPKKK